MPPPLFGLDIAGEPLILRQKEAVMLNISLLALTLWGDVLVQPFRIAEAEPGHHQGCVRAAMAPDGHFAVAWVDSLQPHGASLELDLYIRFFDRDGNPLTDAYKITKMADTNRIYWPCLEMDTAGNVVLVCEEEDRARFDDLDNHYIRFQRFAPDGSPVGSAQTLVPQREIHGSRPIGLSLANSDEFAIAWCAPSTLGYGAWVQRFNREGYPKDKAFLAHDDFGTSVYFKHPQVALKNDAGDLAVTWYEFDSTYPRFQVFDAADESILPWEPMGHLVNEDKSGGSRVEAYWLDNDRFVFFWIDYVWPWHIAGRVFADRGLTRYPIRRLVHDSLALTWPDPVGRFAVAVSSDERFAETHTRSYTDRPDTSDPSKLRWWDHGVGILGYIQDNEPIRRTNLFEYTPPWGADTINSIINNWPHVQFPAVGVCDDRIVWVYSRFNTDTIFEAFAMITDWDMGVGVAESSPKIVSPIQLSASLNQLSYNLPGQASLTLYSADGRRVLTETIQGKGTWTPSPPSSQPSSHLPSGVYFARVKNNSASARAKVVILH
ncbi:hypothetical protein CEE36_06380 [candidate division TA06 bacterium B3_TA06]|uniref:Secretion system C-terminal sorting domain-containing protein n=1 Tax=candidate division TA06 bacterium B3_TA06 TaxID=2012487 RepID=A0A532V6S7_UNCT6|nr:MAG: hypothetical protein CEE36_06380 [candidate division TA06 bacterium B3_TA06]